jgi:hypothetical protein
MIPRALFSELVANGIATASGAELDFHPVVKIFDPYGSAIWLLTEVDPADPKQAFGLCDLGLGCPELGYVDLDELAAIRTAFHQPLRVDRDFRPNKRLSEYAADARRAGRIVA